MTSKQNSLYPTIEEMIIDAELSKQNHNCLSIYPQLTMDTNDKTTNNQQNNDNSLPISESVLNYITMFKDESKKNYEKACVKMGLREVILCKNQQGKIGLSFNIINIGLFVSAVEKESPAALAGIRFGEQLICINDYFVSGIKKSKIEKIIQDIPLDVEIKMVFRDRPDVKIFNLVKDNTGLFGFTFKKGNITNIIKDTSGTRNGLQINHQIIEVNGQNVIGFTDTELYTLFKNQKNTITITVMKYDIYKKMISKVNLENMSHISQEI